MAASTEIRIAGIRGEFIKDKDKYEKIGRLADKAIQRALELVPEETDLNR